MLSRISNILAVFQKNWQCTDSPALLYRVVPLSISGPEGHRDSRRLHDLVATLSSDRCQYVFLAIAFVVLSQGAVLRVHIPAQAIASVSLALPVVGPVAVRMRTPSIRPPQQRTKGRY